MTGVARPGRQEWHRIPERRPKTACPVSVVVPRVEVVTAAPETRPPETEAAAPPAWLPLVAVGVTLVLWASAFVAIRHLAGAFGPGRCRWGGCWSERCASASWP